MYFFSVLTHTLRSSQFRNVFMVEGYDIKENVEAINCDKTPMEKFTIIM